MISKDDIEHLAKLSRIDVTEEEKESLSKDLESILGYVGQIKEVTGEEVEKKVGKLRNVLREDKNPHKTGLHTEKILNEAPEREGGFIKVKNIL